MAMVVMGGLRCVGRASADTFPLAPVDLNLALRLGCGRGPGGRNTAMTP
jgi:hypothetical protein